MIRFSQACENNKQPILEILKVHFKEVSTILEIGSGTGQHAVYFSQHLPYLFWQPSDQLIHHQAINNMIATSPRENLGSPFPLDVACDQDWQKIMYNGDRYDGVFSANTAHIMSWSAVEAMFSGVGALLNTKGKLVLYGPFNRNGAFTSESNKQFHQHLQQQDNDMGIRDDQAIRDLGKQHQLHWIDDIAMPANNRILVFEKRPIL